MRARIYKTYQCGLYWGQIYDESLDRWRSVTDSCFTKKGALRELKKWKERTSQPEEFEL